jgi:hypothetical protein
MFCPEIKILEDEAQIEKHIIASLEKRGRIEKRKGDVYIFDDGRGQ